MEETVPSGRNGRITQRRFLEPNTHLLWYRIRSDPPCGSRPAWRSQCDFMACKQCELRARMPIRPRIAYHRMARPLPRAGFFDWYSSCLMPSVKHVLMQRFLSRKNGFHSLQRVSYRHNLCCFIASSLLYKCDRAIGRCQ